MGAQRRHAIIWWIYKTFGVKSGKTNRYWITSNKGSEIVRWVQRISDFKRRLSYKCRKIASYILMKNKNSIWRRWGVMEKGRNLMKWWCWGNSEITRKFQSKNKGLLHHSWAHRTRVTTITGIWRYYRKSTKWTEEGKTTQYLQ